MKDKRNKGEIFRQVREAVKKEKKFFTMSKTKTLFLHVYRNSMFSCPLSLLH